MSDCVKCIFYTIEMDKLYQSGEDVIYLNRPERERHYCLKFRSLYKGIPKKIWEQNKNCKRFCVKT